MITDSCELRSRGLPLRIYVEKEGDNLREIQDLEREFSVFELFWIKDKGYLS